MDRGRQGRVNPSWNRLPYQPLATQVPNQEPSELTADELCLQMTAAPSVGTQNIAGSENPVKRCDTDSTPIVLDDKGPFFGIFTEFVAGRCCSTGRSQNGYFSRPKPRRPSHRRVATAAAPQTAMAISCEIEPINNAGKLIAPNSDRSSGTDATTAPMAKARRSPRP
jgi:hypothetical protein